MPGKSLVALLFGLVILLSSGCSDNGDEDGALRIGALLPLTGSLSSYGETSKAALEDAVAAINSREGADIDLIIEDTKTDPAAADERLRALAGRGIKVVIGPYSSAEVRQAKPFADSNGVILMSPLSTARSLAIPNDNVLRFTPDDEQEGKAVAGLAWADGIRVIVPVTRDDEGNKGLQAAMKTTFESLGGQFRADITYPANESDFVDEAATLATAIRTEQAAGRSVGVYLTAFNEVTKLFAAAVAGDPILATVKWYGSDSVALSKELTEDRTAAAFAVTADYPNPILGLADADKSKWGPVSERLVAKLGRAPDAFALAAIDALEVAYQVQTSVPRDAAAEALRRELAQTSGRYRGLTGSTELNEAGDRVAANYDFWSVCARGGSFTWVRSAVYEGGAQARAVRQSAC